MRKILPLAALLLCLLGGRVAWAVNCPPNPFTFAEGTTGFATQVMANFNNLLNCANTILFGPGSGPIPAASLPTRATFLSFPADPAGTTSLAPAAVYAGMGSTCKITPATTGTVVFHYEFAGTSVSPGGAAFALYYGSGTAPANGAAVPGSGTALTVYIAAVAGSGGMPWSLTGIATGLTAGTSYWFDVAHEAIINATAATLQRTNCMAWELN
jgi:hypothetical protein